MLQHILCSVEGHATPVLAHSLYIILQYLGTQIYCTHVYFSADFFYSLFPQVESFLVQGML